MSGTSAPLSLWIRTKIMVMASALTIAVLAIAAIAAITNKSSSDEPIEAAVEEEPLEEKENVSSFSFNLVSKAKDLHSLKVEHQWKISETFRHILFHVSEEIPPQYEERDKQEANEGIGERQPYKIWRRKKEPNNSFNRSAD